MEKKKLNQPPPFIDIGTQNTISLKKKKNPPIVEVIFWAL